MRFDSKHLWTALGALYLGSLAVACASGNDSDSGLGDTPGGGGSTAGNGNGTAGRQDGGAAGAAGAAGTDQAGQGGADSCSGDAQCAPGICENEQCVAAECETDTDCSGDDVCEVGRCQAQACAVEITFTYTPDGAAPEEVFLAGTFNTWSMTAEPLTEQQDGTFEVTISLPPGNHEYKFVVDGEWVRDTENPRVVDDGVGGLSSVAVTDCDGLVPPECVEDGECTGDDICESYACVAPECTTPDDCDTEPYCLNGRCSESECQPAVEFVYTTSGETPISVHLAGEFNAWDTTAEPLTQQLDGSWTVSIDSLENGQSYEYKFVVLDTGGEHWEFDPNNLRSNGSNSVALVDCDGLVLPECTADDECSAEICEDYLCVAPECTIADDCDTEPYCVNGRCSESACQPTVDFVYTPTGETPISVHLAGEFNAWSTTAEPLTQQLDGSWTVSVDSLVDGQSYEYKFVVLDTGGEHWEFDNNNLRSNGSNSVALVDCDGLVLPECTVDGDCSAEICEDYLCVAPECSIDDDCADGEECVDGRCETACVPNAEFVYTPTGETPISVHLAGEFNGWSTTAEPLAPQINGDWTVTLTTLEDGQSYAYKFVVLDTGGEHWEFDNNNLRSNGSDSVALISCDGIVLPECVDDGGCDVDLFCRDYACVGSCDYTFTYAGDATTVNVAGEFNSWDPNAWAMVEVATDSWEGTFPLVQDSYEYKLVLDGSNWILDPSNPLQQNTNSLLNHTCGAP